MKSARECKDRFEDIVAFVMGEVDAPTARELQVHIAACDRCRAGYDALVEEEQEVRSGFEALARSLGPVERLVLEEEEHQSRVRVGLSNNRFLEKVKHMIFAHKRLSAAAAAITALAASLVLYVSLLSSSAPAYALEQTAQANDRVTSYHVKITPAAELGEAWVQLNPDGTPLRARMDLLSPDDGPKVVILSEEKAEIWVKDKPVHLFITDKDGIKGIMAMRSIFDPKWAFDELQAAKEAGKVQVTTKEPAKEGDPITLTVTNKDAPDRRDVFEVDPQTKLVKRAFDYRRKDNQWKQVSLVEYLDYNKEIDPKVFQLDLPEDVITLDQVNRKPGLVKGDLTDEEMAMKVAREFFEALIAEDYEKAGLILEGTPADGMKKMFGRFKFFRIVEIGKPTPDPKRQALVVPAKVEWEVASYKDVKECSPKVPLTDDKTATKAVRDFFEALINEDYATAQKILEKTKLVLPGFDEEGGKDLHKLHDQVKFLRIIEIGTPVPHPDTKELEVPVKVEFETKSRREVREFQPAVRPPHGCPDRRVICGGV